MVWMVQYYHGLFCIFVGLVVWCIGRVLPCISGFFSAYANTFRPDFVRPDFGAFSVDGGRAGCGKNRLAAYFIALAGRWAFGRDLFLTG